MDDMTNPGRDILSNDDIAATCGDADCATSDAEMTDADRAMLAQVDAEIAAPVALTKAEMTALPQMTKLTRLDDGAAYVKAYGSDAYAVNADGSYVKGGRKIGWKPGRFALAA